MASLNLVLELGGCDLRYADSGGADQPVVFLHGAGADHVMFARQRDGLVAAGFRVILLDLRGHGVSRPNTVPLTSALLIDDTEALVAHLGLTSLALVGHSLGGNLAQELVRRAPQRYAALAVLDATWNTGYLTLGERLALASAATALRTIPTSVLRRMLVNASAVTTDSREDLTRAFSVMSKAEFISAWLAASHLVSPDPAYRTPIPLLLVRGERDRTGNIASAMPGWAVAEGVEEVVIPEAGHVVTQDAPQAVVEALLTFLRRTKETP